MINHQNNASGYEFAMRVAEILNQHNFEAYIIGGAIRDIWLGREPKDFDLVTNATPDQIMRIPEFTVSAYQDTAQAFGVTRVTLSQVGVKDQIEVATFRKDLDAHKGRKATKVAFAELEDDVLRRDFTINALALDTSTNQVIDYVGGIADLDNKLVRFIGEAGKRIREDPLRIMRAIRFKNHLNFLYHPSTTLAITRSVEQDYIEVIAVDRMRDELTKLLLHTSRRLAVQDLDVFGILQRVLPEVSAGRGVAQPEQFHSEGDVWQHELLILDYLPSDPSKRLVWAALLHDIGKGPTSIKPAGPKERIHFDRHYAVGAEMTKTVLRRLKFSNHDVKEISWIVYNHMSIDDLPAMRPSRQQQMLGHPAFEDLLELHKADAAASWRPESPHGAKPKFSKIEHLWQAYRSMPEALRQPSLKLDLGIDGNWLLSELKKDKMNIKGPLIGKILDELDDWYRDEGVTNKDLYVAKVHQIMQGLTT